MPSERASRKEQNGTSFSSVAPSSEELGMFKVHCNGDLYHVCIFEWEANFGAHNSSLEGAMKLKFASFCSS